jgi:hypothetical protein
VHTAFTSIPYLPCARPMISSAIMRGASS